MDADAGVVTVAVLAHALGITADVAPLVAAMSPGYVPGTTITGEADAAVDALVTVLGGRYDEETATTIAILVQAHDATRGLVTRARSAGTSMPVETLLVETLRWDPPVPWLRRVGPDGERVGIDVRAANCDGAAHLTFGAGLRPCPGAAQALAIAAGILEGR
jgi:cytochrome P450